MVAGSMTIVKRRGESELRIGVAFGTYRTARTTEDPLP